MSYQNIVNKLNLNKLHSLEYRVICLILCNLINLTEMLTGSIIVNKWIQAKWMCTWTSQWKTKTNAKDKLKNPSNITLFNKRQTYKTELYWKLKLSKYKNKNRALKMP